MNHSIVNKYVGDLRTSSEHIKSGNIVITDAPPDNNGKGEAFAPTDLVVFVLCSCMTVQHGDMRRKRNFDMPKSEARIIKIMSENPRKIHQINIEINFEENH